MREIVLDIETTGLDPYSGHRIVEIGCLELTNHIPTDNHYHQYINPERDIPIEVFNIHGLSREFLSDKPIFSDITKDFLSFINNDTLIIHNASFDIKFINAELEKLGQPLLLMDRVLDTMHMARSLFPGAQINLDALCKRFNIDNSNRVKHGALIDCQLLAGVYLELMGGRQHGLVLATKEKTIATKMAQTDGAIRSPRAHSPLESELVAHAAFLKKIKNPLWHS